jgi:hypothetical protein
MRKVFYFSAFFVLGLSNGCTRQPTDDRILAHVGDLTITVGDFKAVSSTIPTARKEAFNSLDKKKLLLNAIVIKKVELIAAKRSMPNAPTQTVEQQETLRKQFMHQLVKEKLTASHAEVSKELQTHADRYAPIPANERKATASNFLQEKKVLDWIEKTRATLHIDVDNILLAKIDLTL